MESFLAQGEASPALIKGQAICLFVAQLQWLLVARSRLILTPLTLQYPSGYTAPWGGLDTTTEIVAFLFFFFPSSNVPSGNFLYFKLCIDNFPL